MAKTDEARELREANARAAEKLLYHADILQRSSCGSVVAAEQKARPGTRVPYSERGEAFAIRNRRAIEVLRPLLDRLHERPKDSGSYVRICGERIYLRDLLRECGWGAMGNPAAIRHWKAATGGLDAKKARALEVMCGLVADAVGADPRTAGERLEISVPARHEPLEREEWMTAHNRDNNEKKTLEAQDSYRDLNAEMDEIRAQGAPDDKEAIKVLRARRKARKDPDVSPATIYRARAFCRGEVEMVERGQVYRLKDGNGDDGEAA